MENHIPFLCPQSRKEAKETEDALRSSTRQHKGLENSTYTMRLKGLHVFALSRRN